LSQQRTVTDGCRRLPQTSTIHSGLSRASHPLRAWEVAQWRCVKRGVKRETSIRVFTHSIACDACMQRSTAQRQMYTFGTLWRQPQPQTKLDLLLFACRKGVASASQASVDRRCAPVSHTMQQADAQLSQLAVLWRACSRRPASSHDTEVLCEPRSPASPAHTFKSIGLRRHPQTAKRSERCLWCCNGHTRAHEQVQALGRYEQWWFCPSNLIFLGFIEAALCGWTQEKSQSQVHSEFDGSLLARGRHRLTSLSSSLSARVTSAHTHLSAAGHRSLSSDRTVAHQLLLSAGARLSCARCG
jgi:hypothetical protein